MCASVDFEIDEVVVSVAKAGNESGCEGGEEGGCRKTSSGKPGSQKDRDESDQTV